MAKLTEWKPEDAQTWRAGGSRVAWRNLTCSVPSLLCAFSVWMFWSILTAKMKDAGFPFTDAQLFTIVGIAGLAGATLRIPSSFLVALAGGRNVVGITTALLIAPALGAGVALQDRSTPFATFAALAVLSGVGGGNFSSSMSNITGFFPKRLAGLALGLNAGIGNLGVSVMQFLVPVVMAGALFGGLAGAPHLTAAGKALYIQNGALVWVPLLVIFTAASWFGMNNLPAHDSEPTGAAVGRILALQGVGLAVSGVGAWILVKNPALPLGLQLGLVLLVVALCLGAMKLFPGKVKASLDRQFAIFRMKHNWVMTVLYIMTFGSFIGYSASFPLLIKIVFKKDPSAYAFLGPLLGSLIRPVGGWLSDKLRGSVVTQWSTAIQIAGALLVAHYVKAAVAAPDPSVHFAAFMASFMLLFLGSGIGNGSTFQMVPFIFEPQFAGPVLGWTGAAAAYGSFIIPTVFKSQIKPGAVTVENALYGFAAFYVLCLALNWWYYVRKDAEVRC
ncbi:MFS transporter [Geothrix terrae]|uniref:MFS transporter n=1 Tax=Geothrix terrae TaxID=2922720 RepID=UPI001FABA70E|nr:MFS transporter [Geothrix terrae]